MAYGERRYSVFSLCSCKMASQFKTTRILSSPSVFFSAPQQMVLFSDHQQRDRWNSGGRVVRCPFQPPFGPIAQYFLPLRTDQWETRQWCVWERSVMPIRSQQIFSPVAVALCSSFGDSFLLPRWGLQNGHKMVPTENISAFHMTC